MAKHFIKLVFGLLLIGSQTSLATKIFHADSLPETLQQAISIRGYTVENQITSTLDGKSRGSVIVKIEFESKNQFVLYQDKSRFELADSLKDLWKIDEVINPPSTSFIDPITKKIKKGYSGQNVFELKLSLKTILPKPLPLEFVFAINSFFQACNKQVCLLPAIVEISIPLRNNSSQGDQDEEKSFLEGLSDRLKKSLGNDGFSFSILHILFLAGLLTAFTPCVYPLYPITIGIFVNWSRLGIRPWILGLSYCAGSILSYSILGLIAVASGKVFGSLTQTPAFQISIGVILILSAIFYSGLLEFPIPESIRSFFSQSKSDSSNKPARKIGEAFAMGFGLGIVASPCVGPVLLALLAWMSGYLNPESYASWLEGLGLFATFGAGLMTPFLILSILVGRGFKTPRLGVWAQRAKWAGSLLMLAGSMFFLVPGLKALMPSKSHKNFNFVILNTEDPLPPNGRPSILDFRADWCVACLELEGETFQDPRVTLEFRNSWNFKKIDLTQSSTAGDLLSEKYQVLGLPSVLFLDPSGKFCARESLSGFENAEKFLSRLNRVKKSCE